MNKLSLSFLLPLPILFTQANAVEVNRINIDLKHDQYVNYTGTNQKFALGFKTGFGSSLTFYKQGLDGSYYFYGLTDRGPNGDAPCYKSKDGKIYASKFFLTPEFCPKIALIKVKDSKATIERTISLKSPDGKEISGLPLASGKIGSTNEVGLDDALNVLKNDDYGLDPEGIAIDKDGNFYIGDEYGPFLVKYSKDGTEIDRMYPGYGLPEIFKYRTENRGCEGVAMTPSGKLAVLEQSILNLKHDGLKSAHTAKFTRVAITDPNTKEYKTFAYPIDALSYKKPGDAKLGDIYALSDTEFLIIEQGKDKFKKMRNLVYKVDFSDATDISDFKKDGFEPEFYNDAAGIIMGKKELVADLRALGYYHEKAEGITLLPDRQTLVIINDNDFGVEVKIKDNKRKEKITKYTVTNKGKLMFNGRSADAKIKIDYLKNEDSVNELFFVKLDSKL